jgi:hypothetical protein
MSDIDAELDARLGMGANNPPVEIDPEHLLVLPYDEIPALLERNYAPLTERKGELQEQLKEWLAQHLAPKPRPNAADVYLIADDADLARSSDVLAQLDTFTKDGDDGEVDGTRRRVKKGPFEAGKAIDAFFKALREPLMEHRQRIVQAQSVYLGAKRAQQEAEARAEAERQRRAAEEARLAAEEAARAAQSAEEPDEDAIFAAELAAEEAGQAAAEVAAARPVEVASTKVQSSLGTTTFLKGTWKFRVVDIKALAAAVAAGTVPASFLTTNDSVINASIKGATGVRQAAGLEIYQEQTAGRRR